MTVVCGVEIIISLGVSGLILLVKVLFSTKVVGVNVVVIVPNLVELSVDFLVLSFLSKLCTSTRIILFS